MHSLPLFHRIAGARVVVVGEGEMAAAKARLVERAGGIPCPETEA
ncbi:MAG TPA: siroheme synthase, partial [Erythrobacter sp.]|nr:siroheme synthase [Erythrobacter sp.]